MSVAVVGLENEQANSKAAENAMHAVADGLAAQGFEISGPAWDASHYLKITNVRGTWCEIMIGENGSVSWEYRPFDRSRTDPAQITDMVMVILGADSAGYPPPKRYPGVTLKGVIGRALSDRGMLVSLDVVDVDDFFYDVYAEIGVTNPARKDRGKAWFTDDSVIRWECSLADRPGGARGIGFQEITDTITRVLTGPPHDTSDR